MIELKIAWRITSFLMKFLALTWGWMFAFVAILLGRRKYQKLLADRARRIGDGR